MELERELSSVLNRFSQENASNTPDFILAQFLLGCLAAWNTGVQQRETWYGRDARPCSLGGAVADPSGASRERTEPIPEPEVIAPTLPTHVRDCKKCRIERGAWYPCRKHRIIPARERR